MSPNKLHRCVKLQRGNKGEVGALSLDLTPSPSYAKSHSCPLMEGIAGMPFDLVQPFISLLLQLSLKFLFHAILEHILSICCEAPLTIETNI